ncbi:hypothetical protein BS50DRAFT_487174 [Corynespora cassiicola Philippines]|uniref:Sld7 C-terminal domain-containing protein n=1 Tax=Corynespora cassiicola Philippines TaxID=1448308 RepID=A0A2T2NZ91_CORCC|nr:hypothetical protein BS50DRAFT_487174 [Corynespora cassiicola Philippines]
MADVWTGDILLPDGSAVKEIILSSHHVASAPSLPTTALRFASVVDTARIPLYLATGPSLDVATFAETTQAWFESLLLSKAPTASGGCDANSTLGWWSFARAQSPIGVLVQVESHDEAPGRPRITEILFYGTISLTATTVLPTPPSSSPEATTEQPENLPELRVHALPLSSDLLPKPTDFQSSPVSHALGASDPPANPEPQFLPPLYSPQTARSPKKKRDVRDIFDEAAIARKKARGQGGEGIAAAAARANESQRPFGHRKSLSIDTKGGSFADGRPPSAGILSRPGSSRISRSPSISSDARPLSRKGPPDGHSKRSTLSQVATVPIQPEEPTVETRNKEALTKVVMAAMRMHGLQQRKKSRRNSVAHGVDALESLSAEAAAEEAAKDEEFKQIYHQTYKGAVLALRKHISTKPLHSQPDRLRDVVERFLAIFCTDPLSLPLPSDEQTHQATPGSKLKLGVPGSTHGHASPFDQPSAKAQAGKTTRTADVFTGSPVSKRKGKKPVLDVP